MVTRVNQINADYYELKINPSGEMRFDVGVDGSNPANNGKVTINGNLDVLGATTSIGSSELIVDDNTITVNNGETGAGITLGTAGVIVDRGTRDDAQWLFDESLITLRNATQIPGAFVAKLATGDYTGIHASSITTDTNQDLYLINQGTGVVTVYGTTDYEEHIWNYTAGEINPDPSQPDGLEYPPDDDVLINAKGLIDYVEAYHNYNYQDKISRGTVTESRVQVFDAERGDGTSRVEIAPDDSIVATFYSNRVDFENIRLDDDIITNNGINGNVVIKGAGTGNVVIDDYLQLNELSDPASNPSEGSVLYSKPLGDGGTGVYFTNTDGTQDELVSRNKALLYSIIF